MTWPTSSGVRSSIVKIAVAGALIAIPTAGVSIPLLAMPGGTSNLAPSTDAPEPPPPPPAPAYSYDSGYDWWAYGAGDGGAGGGGGGG